MKNISILDCTLRDGGRIIDCAFKSDAIVGIGKQLKLAGINIIEMGFLRNGTYAERILKKMSSMFCLWIMVCMILGF